jgi:hypothetical protein
MGDACPIKRWAVDTVKIYIAVLNEEIVEAGETLKEKLRAD